MMVFWFYLTFLKTIKLKNVISKFKTVFRVRIQMSINDIIRIKMTALVLERICEFSSKFKVRWNSCTNP